MNALAPEQRIERTFRVFLRSRLIDMPTQAFFPPDFPSRASREQEMKSLLLEDGYHPDIRVEEVR